MRILSDWFDGPPPMEGYWLARPYYRTWDVRMVQWVGGRTLPTGVEWARDMDLEFCGLAFDPDSAHACMNVVFAEGTADIVDMVPGYFVPRVNDAA